MRDNAPSNNLPIYKRYDKPLINLRLLSDERPRFTTIFCMWCTKRIGTINSNVVAADDSPELPQGVIQLTVSVQCERCKQRYRYVIAKV